MRCKHHIDAIPDLPRDFSRLRLPNPDFISHCQYIFQIRVYPVSAYGDRMFPVQRAAVSEVIGRCKSIAGILLIIQTREVLGMGNCSILSMQYLLYRQRRHHLKQMLQLTIKSQRVCDFNQGEKRDFAASLKPFHRTQAYSRSLAQFFL